MIFNELYIYIYSKRFPIKQREVSFFLEETFFPLSIVSKRGIQMDSTQVEAINLSPHFKTLCDACSFLGLCSQIISCFTLKCLTRENGRF